MSFAQKIIFYGPHRLAKKAAEWCKELDMDHQTNFVSYPNPPSPFGVLPGEEDMNLSYYFFFQTEEDAAAFCLVYGNNVVGYSVNL